MSSTRMRRWGTVGLLLLTTAIAGCLGDGSGDGADVRGEPQQLAPSSRGEGQSRAPTSGEGGRPGGVAEEPASMQAVVVDWDGKVPLAACVPTGPNGCTGFTVTPGDRWLPLALDGAPAAVDVELTWDAATPLTATMGIGLFGRYPCGSGATCSMWLDGAEGTSPVTLTVRDVDGWEDGWAPVLMVWLPRQMPSPVYGYANPEQAFHVEGVVQGWIDPPAQEPGGEAEGEVPGRS